MPRIKKSNELGNPLPGRYERLNGAVDREWLDKLITAVYPLNVDQDPRQAAEVAFVALDLDLTSGHNQH